MDEKNGISQTEEEERKKMRSSIPLGFVFVKMSLGSILTASWVGWGALLPRLWTPRLCVQALRGYRIVPRTWSPRSSSRTTRSCSRQRDRDSGGKASPFSPLHPPAITSRPSRQLPGGCLRSATTRTRWGRWLGMRRKLPLTNCGRSSTKWAFAEGMSSTVDRL